MKNRPHESPDCKCVSCREWETTQAMYSLHSRGSIPIEMILELLNLDPEEVRQCWLNGSAHIMDDELRAYVDCPPQEEQTITWNCRLSM